jgi:hypothetical protein
MALVDNNTCVAPRKSEAGIFALAMEVNYEHTAIATCSGVS